MVCESAPNSDWTGSHATERSPRRSASRGVADPQPEVRAGAFNAKGSLFSIGCSDRIAVLTRTKWNSVSTPSAIWSPIPHLHVTATESETREDFYPNYSAYLRPLFQGPMPRQTYEQMLATEGSLVGGDASSR